MSPATSRSSHAISAVQLVLLAAAVAIAGAGGYFAGASGGPDITGQVSQARTDGQRSGVASGSRDGMKSGIAAGRKATYDAAYKQGLNRGLAGQATGR